MRILAEEAARVLETARAEDPPAWSSRAFASRVQVARHQLAPIVGILGLVDSFRREATHLAGGDASRGAGPSEPASKALETAYAIRWVELSTGVELPEWQACSHSRAARG